MNFVFNPKPQAFVEIAGASEYFPVHRIYCVGRNYAEHALEMGADPEREEPFFFCKPADAVVPSGSFLDYPSATQNLHHEIELVAALHKGGRNIPQNDALDHVFGYAVGLDLTRRDLQAEAKKKGRPWDSAKAFDHSAPCSAIPEVIMKLSQMFELVPGDLIFTGTPAGVGPVQSGDLLQGRIESIGELEITFR